MDNSKIRYFVTCCDSSGNHNLVIVKQNEIIKEIENGVSNVKIDVKYGEQVGMRDIGTNQLTFFEYDGCMDECDEDVLEELYNRMIFEIDKEKALTHSSIQVQQDMLEME